MKSSLALLLILLLAICGFTQIDKPELAGTYSSINNKFERWSNMNLKPDGRFVYSYGVGGCQGEVTGNYRVVGKRIEFKNDDEFTNEFLKKENSTIILNDSTTINIGTPMYPDLSLIKWEIGRNHIKPLQEVDSGCIKESGRHKRRK